MSCWNKHRIIIQYLMDIANSQKDNMLADAVLRTLKYIEHFFFSNKSSAPSPANTRPP